MPDETQLTVDKIRGLLDANKVTNGNAPTPTIAPTPAPGFRFAVGDKVIDLITGGRGVVVAWYQSASNAGPIYEVRKEHIGIIARLEKELERDGPQNMPPSLPRI